jgi:hypothetical protein
LVEAQPLAQLRGFFSAKMSGAAVAGLSTKSTYSNLLLRIPFSIMLAKEDSYGQNSQIFSGAFEKSY